MQLTQLAVTESAAAKATGCSVDTFRRMRHAGTGPPWIKVGSRSIRYPVKELRAWIAHQMARNERVDA